MQRIAFVAGIVSAAIQRIFVLVVAVLPIVLNVDAVRRLRRSTLAGNGLVWQRRAAYAGACCNAFVYALPLALLIHNVIVITPWDSDPIQDAIFAFFLLSIILAIVGPAYVRLQLIIGPLIPILFWLLLPRGIL